jgi:hypothetical protein
MKNKLKALILACLLLASPCFAVNLTQNLVNWELNASATAADVNGGGFDWGNANFLTDLACTTATGNTPDCSSASITFVQADALHWIFVKSGTHWAPGWYYITDACVSSVWQPAGSGACTTGHIRMNAASGAAVQQNTTVGLPSPAYVANTVAGMSSDATASLTAGTFGVDYSQATAAITNDTDLGCTNAAPSVCTSTNKAFGLRMVGNVVHITTTGTGAHFLVGWYEVVSVSGVNATLDRNATDGVSAGVAGTFYVGGAIGLGNALDPTVFAQGYATGVTANRFFIKYGSYTLGANLTGQTVGLAEAPMVVEGYNSLRGDRPTGANRPTITVSSTYGFALTSYWDVYNLILTGSTTSSPLSIGIGGKATNIKAVQTSTTAAAHAITGVTNGFFLNCEAISYRGIALSVNSAQVEGCYLHDSDIGFSAAASPVAIRNSIIESNVTAAVQNTAVSTSLFTIQNSTLYGGENKTGLGVNLFTGSYDVRIVDSILYGFTTGITHADASQTGGYDDYNDFYDNTTAATNWQKGIHDLALNPTFTNVAQYTGSGASTTTGTLTDAAVDFTTYGIVGNQDFVNVTAGGTLNLGQYLITSVASTHVLNLSPAPGTGTAVTYQITTGRNFMVTNTSLKNAGFPGAFPAGITTGYVTPGAVQPQVTAAGASQHNTGFVQ